MDTEFDVCIIGSGAGAGPVAYTLANKGHKVLVLEKGGWFDEKDFNKDEIAVCRRDTFTPPLIEEPQVIESLNKKGEWKAKSNKNSGQSFWNGNIVGGSSNFMSGFFHRMKPVDFRLLSEFGSVENANVADWPISYDELEPYYTRTELIVGVSGKVVKHPFLEPRSMPDFPFAPLQEHPMAAILDKASDQLNYNMIPMARAILSRPHAMRNSCSYSGYCGSYGCTTGAKGSSRAALLGIAKSTGNCTIRPKSHVYKIESNKQGKAVKALFFDKDNNKKEVKAKIFVVACQAIETARLLLLSTGPKFPNGLANNNGQVGKNLIFSAGGIGSCKFQRGQFTDEEFEKMRDIHLFVNRAIQDWYIIDDKKLGRIKGGTIDFLLSHANPIRKSNRLKWGSDGLVWGEELKTKLADYFKNTVKLNFEIFCDWNPHDDCFVTINKKVKDKYGLPVAQVRIANHPKDLIPGHYLADKAREIAKAANGEDVNVSISGSPPTNLVAGGCRFGNDPNTSVLDKNCRSHEVENLYVTDGSFMPTGGSITYTWTIYANAFRVAEQISKEL